MREYKLKWDANNPLFRSVCGGTIAVPKQQKVAKPLIIFIHGHGMVRNFSGAYRSDLFQSDDLANEILKRGYAVWAPDNVFHEELKVLYRKYDYSNMWAKVIAQSWEVLSNICPRPPGAT